LVELQAPDPSGVIDISPILLNELALTMREMPVVEENAPTKKLEEFARLVNEEGMSRFDASLLVFGKKYSGEHAMELKRHLSSLSFSSPPGESAAFDENDDENENEGNENIA
jgi:hypothetical protein